ncbi:MAG: RagB/SusD family nutrient uptake outer membrane protein [Ignavibacteriaceae bacterium]
MKKINLFLIIILASLMMSSCKDYVTNIDPPINQIENAKLNSPAQIPFLVAGVQTRFANATSQLNNIADGLSDEFIFDSNVPNATYPTYRDINNGTIRNDNNSIRNVYTPLGQYRYLADNLIVRVNKMNVSDATLKNSALFTGNFYGGYARYQYATYWGKAQTTGGSPIDGGPFIASSTLYDQAITLFKASLAFTTDATTIRIVNSCIARAYLYKGDYANAATYAKLGMVSGDAPFQALHSVQESSDYWGNSGNGRTQFVCDPRFRAYVVADPNEANRVKLAPKLGNDKKTTYYYQVKYPANNSPEDEMTWQENNLMLAELAIRGQATGDPVALVNAVRASHDIAALVTVDMDVIYTERDKELFCTGSRLPDERRFNKWHLPAGTWQYFPLTIDEINSNKNL